MVWTILLIHAEMMLISEQRRAQQSTSQSFSIFGKLHFSYQQHVLWTCTHKLFKSHHIIQDHSQRELRQRHTCFPQYLLIHVYLEDMLSTIALVFDPVSQTRHPEPSHYFVALLLALMPMLLGSDSRH